jgi:hypothetical protein
LNSFSSIQCLKCLFCRREYPVAPVQEGCPECRAAQGPAILDAVYRLGADEARAIRETGRARFWDHHPLLPVPDREGMVTLGEGNSPLLSLPQAAEETRADQVWVKYEAVNPTHSWKDRTNAVAAAMAGISRSVTPPARTDDRSGIRSAWMATRPSHSKCFVSWGDEYQISFSCPSVGGTERGASTKVSTKCTAWDCLPTCHK